MRLHDEAGGPTVGCPLISSVSSQPTATACRAVIAVLSDVCVRFMTSFLARDLYRAVVRFGSGFPLAAPVLEPVLGRRQARSRADDA